MSNAYMKAADALKREAVRFQGLVEAAEVLEKMGSLEQAEQETIARLKKVRDEVADAQLAVGVSRAEAAKMIEAAESLTRQREAVADQGVREARERAEAIVSEGAKRVKEMLVKAEQDQNAAIQRAQGEVAAAQLAKAAAEKVLVGVKAELDARSNELSKVDAKLAAAREAVAKLLR